MDNKTSSIEYEILGYKVKLQESTNNMDVTPEEVVEFVRNESNKINNRLPHLDRGEIALLAALNIAKESLLAKKANETELSALKEKASKALDLIEEVTPTTM